MELMTQIKENGRIIVPAKFRRALEIKPGDEIVMQLEKSSIRLIPLRQAITLAQKTVRQYVPDGISLVDDLIKARQEESGNE